MTDTDRQADWPTDKPPSGLTKTNQLRATDQEQLTKNKIYQLKLTWYLLTNFLTDHNQFNEIT